MGLHLSSIGAAATLPIELSFKGLSKPVGFAAQLDQSLQSGDVLSQLSGLLQAGTPMATIIGKVSAELSNVLTHASGNAGNADAQRTLQRALANALAPPGTSPPASNSQEQVAMLVQRLRNILTTLTSESNTSGQQSEFSGQVLDARSARELPAQQTKPPTGNTSPTAVSAFVQALLNQVVAGQSAPAAPNSLSAAAQSVQSAQTPPMLPATALADPLTRILARAVNASVQRGDAPVKPATSTSSSATSPSALFERMIAIIAESADAKGDAHTGGEGGKSDAWTPTLLPAQSDASQTSATPTFALHVASAPVSTAQMQPAARAAAPIPFDPQAVIEQVVKGIVFRNSGTTSEVRLRLQPEQLGDVALKLTVNGNTISANIVAQSAHVRDMLLSNQQQLARSLSESGLSLGNFSVDVSGGNAGFTDQRSQQQTRAAKTGAFVAALNGEDESWADPRFGPPIFSGSRALVLNYLA